MKTEPKYDAWLFWNVTSRCNLSCAYCNATSPGNIVRKIYHVGFRHVLSTILVNARSTLSDLWKKKVRLRVAGFLSRLTKEEKREIDIPALVRTLDGAGRTFRILFTGGEPFLVGNFVEACEAVSHHHYVELFTNLTSTRAKEFARRVDPERVIEIYAGFHIQELERTGLLDTYVDHFLLLKERGFKISARIVAYPGLARDIEKYRHILGGRGIDVLCDIFRGKYHGKAYPDSYTGREREVFQIAQEKAADGNMLNVPVNSFHPKGKRCNAGRNIGIVFPGGEVQPCYYLFKNMGNIYTGIAFNDSDVTCPFEYCSCPLYAYGPGHLKKYQDAFKYALVTYRGYGRHGKNGRREKKNR